MILFYQVWNISRALKIGCWDIKYCVPKAYLFPRRLLFLFLRISLMNRDSKSLILFYGKHAKKVSYKIYLWIDLFITNTLQPISFIVKMQLVKVQFEGFNRFFDVSCCMQKE